MPVQLLCRSFGISSGIASSLSFDGARASQRATAHGVNFFVFRGDAGAHGLFGHIGSFREFGFFELCGGSGARGEGSTPAGSADLGALPASKDLSRWQQPVAEAREVPGVRNALEDGDRLLHPALRAQGSSGGGRGGVSPHIEAQMRPVDGVRLPGEAPPSASFCRHGVRLPGEAPPVASFSH